MHRSHRLATGLEDATGAQRFSGHGRAYVGRPRSSVHRRTPSASDVRGRTFVSNRVPTGQVPRGSSFCSRASSVWRKLPRRSWRGVRGGAWPSISSSTASPCVQGGVAMPFPRTGFHGCGRRMRTLALLLQCIKHGSSGVSSRRPCMHPSSTANVLRTRTLAWQTHPSDSPPFPSHPPHSTPGKGVRGREKKLPLDYVRS